MCMFYMLLYLHMALSDSGNDTKANQTVVKQRSVLLKLFVGQEQRHRHRAQTGRRRGRAAL